MAHIDWSPRRRQLGQHRRRGREEAAEAASLLMPIAAISRRRCGPLLRWRDSGAQCKYSTQTARKFRHITPRALREPLQKPAAVIVV
jgi:hypothetical protein